MAIGECHSVYEVVEVYEEVYILEDLLGNQIQIKSNICRGGV